MLAKLEKENTIKLVKVECKEIESFTLLHLTDEETVSLINTADTLIKQDNVIIVDINEEVNKLWKRFVKNHKVYSDTPDVSIKYLIVGNINKANLTPETTVLIRNPKTHTIVSGRRGKFGEEKCHINKLYITNEVRNIWWNESCKSQLSSERAKTKNMYNQRFAIDIRDEELYNKWSRYMDVQYLKNTNQQEFIERLEK